MTICNFSKKISKASWFILKQADFSSRSDYVFFYNILKLF